MPFTWGVESTYISFKLSLWLRLSITYWYPSKLGFVPVFLISFLVGRGQDCTVWLRGLELTVEPRLALNLWQPSCSASLGLQACTTTTNILLFFWVIYGTSLKQRFILFHVYAGFVCVHVCASCSCTVRKGYQSLQDWSYRCLFTVLWLGTDLGSYSRAISTHNL